MRHLQHKLPSTTDIRKLVHKLRKRTSEPMSTATCTLQTTYYNLKRNQQTIDGSKITATTTDQSVQLSSFDDQSHHDKNDLSEPRPQK